MPHNEIDNYMNLPEALKSGKDVAAAFYRAEADNLVLTWISKWSSALFVPSEDMLKDDPQLRDELFYTPEEISDYITEYGADLGYSEDDFIELPGVNTFYAVSRKTRSVEELKQSAYAAMTRFAFSASNPSCVQLLFTEMRIGSRVVESGLAVDDIPAVISALNQSGLSEKTLTDIREALELGKARLEAASEFLRAQALPAVSFYELTKRGAAAAYYNPNGVETSISDCLKPVTELPLLVPLKECVDQGISWGVGYDDKTQTLYGTINGVRMEERGTQEQVDPASLSLFLSGYAPYVRKEPYIFLMSDRGAPYLEQIKKVLPDAKTVFEELVNKDYYTQVEVSNAFRLVTDNDKPHGLYLSDYRFIPYAEIISNQNVLHVLDTGESYRRGEDGTVVYECFSELVKTGDRYAIMHGKEGYSEKESDNDRIVDYPPRETDIYIKDNKIEKVVLFTGGKKGTVVESPDTPNAGFSKSGTFGVKESVRAAVLFKACGFLLDVLQKHSS